MEPSHWPVIGQQIDCGLSLEKYGHAIHDGPFPILPTLGPTVNNAILDTHACSRPTRRTAEVFAVPQVQETIRHVGGSKEEE